ncbi:MAG TPA: histidine kinase [Actinomycetota bacterium]|nr:histidine kinase [Actinomycetota bacterium]
MTGSTRSRAAIAWTIAVASAVGMAVNEILGRLWEVQDEGEFPLFFTVFLGTVAMGAVGALVASRTRNPIGWILVAIPAGVTVSLLADTLMKHGAIERPAYLGVASWLTTWPFLLALLLPVAIFYLYPTGTIPSPRWRWPWRIYVGAAIVTVVGFAVQPGTQRPVDDAPPIPNPLGIDALEPALGIILAIAGVTLVLSALASFVSLATRYRAADAEERQQLRWLFAVGAWGAFLLIALLATVIGSGDADEGFAATFADAIILLLAADVSIGIPVATGVAILRYRLWDLNVVVRRAVLVATMAVGITVLYVGIVVAVPLVVGAGDRSGVDVLPLVAAATVAIAFDPLRRGARRLADRVVYGDRATPYEVLTAFGERVGETYASDDVLPRLAHVLARGTGADTASVWLRVGDELRREVQWPDDAGEAVPIRLSGDTLPPSPDGDGFEVRHQGELLGALTVRMPAAEPMEPAKERLIRDLAAQAGLVLRNVRLIEELRASRQRLVAAQDEERRRLERNLHDGAQQQLVALAVQLKLARTLVDRDPAKAGTMLDALQSSATDALEDLRDLARGIYPPLLADKGLAAALDAQARKAPIPVTVDADGIGQYPQEIESAVYFSCLEALNNVAKYATARSAVVTLSERDGLLTFSVTDDGRGFDTTATSYGTGLQGIADRLDAIGGRIDVTSRPGGGTTITGRVPTVGGRV